MMRINENFPPISRESELESYHRNKVNNKKSVRIRRSGKNVLRSLKLFMAAEETAVGAMK